MKTHLEFKMPQTQSIILFLDLVIHGLLNLIINKKEKQPTKQGTQFSCNIILSSKAFKYLGFALCAYSITARTVLFHINIYNEIEYISLSPLVQVNFT